uniref:Uncharacterized protein n=1 Tax=Nelumbo nucifera TaxID=4432 RepID=A0A822ZJ62_NELNU|nr:TPA_asm: hypothetical protein HUJ06_001286 [Nelumbo nucifera]
MNQPQLECHWAEKILKIVKNMISVYFSCQVKMNNIISVFDVYKILLVSRIDNDIAHHIFAFFCL